MEKKVVIFVQYFENVWANYSEVSIPCIKRVLKVNVAKFAPSYETQAFKILDVMFSAF